MTIFRALSERAKRLAFLLALLLGCAGVARSQAAAEFRPHPVDSKDWPKQAVRAAHGMVATDEELGSQAGVEILKRGGNAVDAAVAVAFALAVVEPAAGNIGGGGFMLVRLADGRTSFLDYREVAPGKATRDMYIGADGKLIPNEDVTGSVLGYRSVAVPGTVAGLELALKTYGTLKLAEVMAPAIRLASEGFAVSEKLAHELEEKRPGLQQFPVSKRIFLKDGEMLHAGDTLRQPELAATLQRIAKNGAAEFYRGETAREMVDDITHNGGIITARRSRAVQTKSSRSLARRLQIGRPRRRGAHLGSSYFTSAEFRRRRHYRSAQHAAKNVPLKGWDEVESVHMVAETMRRVFADRAAYLADPDFSNVPVAGLTDPCYAKELEATIDPQRASSSKTVKAGKPHTCAGSCRGQYAARPP